MEILIFLVPLASVIVALAVWAFFWALRRGQFDDLDSPAWRVVFDDQEQQPTEKPDVKKESDQ
jgi:cbb3-type cytochrome oxidase maturation protein